MITRQSLRILLIACFGVFACLAFTACKGESGSVQFFWQEKSKDLQLEIRTDPTLIKTNTELHATFRGNKSHVLIDDVMLTNISILEYEAWVLVLNYQYVVAGINLETGKL